MQQHNDPNKRPLLTDEQLRVIRRGHKRTEQGTPREEFERLFRGSALGASGRGRAGADRYSVTRLEICISERLTLDACAPRRCAIRRPRWRPVPAHPAPRHGPS